MKKDVFKCIFEITSMFFIIFLTYPIWENMEITNSYSVASNYSDYKSNTLNYYITQQADLTNLSPIEDNDYLDEDYTVINVVNNTTEEKEYTFMLTITKESTLDPEYIKLSINDEKPVTLDSLFYTSDDYLDYYVINIDTININEEQEITLILFLDYDTPNEMQNTTLSMNYQIISDNNDKIISYLN